MEELNLSKRKKAPSAFTPYSSNCTVLTNLQRGNTETKIPELIVLNFHERTGQGEISEQQVKALPDVDFLDDHQLPPLFYACYYGQFLSAKLLIEYGGKSWI